MVKKTARGFGELAELGKAFVKEVKKHAGKGAETAVESLTGLTISDENKEEGKKQVEKIKEADDKYRGPEIEAERRKILAMQEEERRIMQEKQQKQQAEIINLDEERKKRSQQGIKGFVGARGKRRESIFPHKQKATTDIPESVERIKRKAA